MGLPDETQWKVHKTLGGGAQGTVYLVSLKNEIPESEYALKWLDKIDSKARTRFQAEVFALQNVQHPNVVKIEDVSVKGSKHCYYGMEYFEGSRTLACLLYTSDAADE